MFKEIDTKIIQLNSFILSSKFRGGKIHGNIKNIKNIGFIEIVSEDGKKGYCENYHAIYSPEIFKTIVNFLQSKIIGKKIKDLRVINEANFIPFIARNGFIKSVLGSIEVALLDLVGKKLNKSVFDLLGLKNNRIKCYYSGGSVIMSPQDIEKDVEYCISQKFSAYKMRLGFQTWKEDIKRIVKAKNILGDKRDIIFDSIMGTHKKIWSLNEAIRKIKILKKFNPMWVEEPLHPDDLDGYEILKKKINTPIAAGEAYSGFLEYMTIIKKRLVNYIQLDITSSGGYFLSKKISKIAKKNFIKIVPHCWGSDATISANLLIAQSNQNVPIFEIPSVNLEISKYIAADSFHIKDGYIRSTNNVGLGIEISKKVKSKFGYKKINSFSL